MKKLVWLFALLMLLPAAGYASEFRDFKRLRLCGIYYATEY
ncbi:hypothetical protein ACH6CV_02330 [Bacillota bacterium Meth-B3]